MGRVSTTAGRKLFITLTAAGKSLTNNLPAGDALSGAGATLTEAQILNSVIDDYNNIQRSYVILALDSDTDFAAQSANRRIYIDVGDAPGLSSGEAELEYSGRRVIGCKIGITDAGLKDAKTYLSLLSHELGHCLGLDHPQETVWAVMSYFYKEDDIYRIGIDDKMGIVHLYPENKSYAEEKATYGFSCATK